MLDSSNNMDSYAHSALDEEPPTNPASEPYQNDHLDDVFGSAPSSPTSHSFGDDEELHLSHTSRNGVRLGNLEPSDIPRMQSKHETEGYRDGVTQGKALSVQAGFDEGYGLGAVLGLKVGRTIGLIEGLYGAVASAAKTFEGGNDHEAMASWEPERKRLEQLLAEARQELKTSNVFGTVWWDEDGTWKFPVPGEGEGKEVVFPDVAAAHPLVVKWDAIVTEEARRWSLDINLLEQDGIRDESAMALQADSPPQTLSNAANALSW